MSIWYIINEARDLLLNTTDIYNIVFVIFLLETFPKEGLNNKPIFLMIFILLTQFLISVKFKVIYLSLIRGFITWDVINLKLKKEVKVMTVIEIRNSYLLCFFCLLRYNMFPLIIHLFLYVTGPHCLLQVVVRLV